MSGAVQTQVRASLGSVQPYVPVRSGLLQRKCTCGASAGVDGACAACRERRLAGQRGAAGIIQAKLTVNRPGDEYEQEADRVADQVLAGPAGPVAGGAAPRIQRLGGQAGGQMGAAPACVDQALAGQGRPLDAGLRQDMEGRFGHDFSQVRVHTDRQAETSARDVDARAYTVGSHVVFGAGQFQPDTAAGKRLMAHELTHVIQQTGPGGITASGQRLARAPIEPRKDPSDVKREHQVDLDHLKELLIKMVSSLPASEQARLDRNGTVALALVEFTDEKNDLVTSLVYTVNQNRNTTALLDAAHRLDIENIGAAPRAEGRGEVGAPGDAEQILEEATSENDMGILGMAILRRPCVDCTEMIKAEDIKTVWLDRHAKKAAFHAGRVYSRGSEDLKKAMDELDQAFMPAVVEPGKESHAGLGPDSPVWGALNHLNIKEMSRVLEVEQQRGRLGRVQEAAFHAHGIYNDRIVAVTAMLDYKKQLESASPDEGVLMGAYDTLRVTSQGLPPQQQEELQSILRPAVRSLVKQQAVPKPQPKSTKPPEKQKPTTTQESSQESSGSVLGKLVKPALIAAGIVVGTIVLVELAEAIASAIFLEVVLAASAGVLKKTAQAEVTEIAAREIRKRVADVSPEKIQKAAETIYHAAEPYVDSALKMVK